MWPDVSYLNITRDGRPDARAAALPVTDTYGDDGRVALDIVDADGDHTIVTIEPPAPQ
jgi:hypothetical protein